MLKSKNYLFKVLIVIAIIVSTIFVFSGCGKKNKNQSNTDDKAYLQPLTNYFEGIKNKELKDGCAFMYLFLSFQFLILN